MLGDTGLLTALVGVGEERLLENSALFGAALENFVVMETRKQISWSRTQPQMFHFRTHTGQEVDVVLEEAALIIVSATEGNQPTEKCRTEKWGLIFLSCIFLFSGRNDDQGRRSLSGKLAGIEVKASASVNSNDFKGLRALQEIAGKNFRRGIALYTGSEVVSFEKDLMAAPIPVLWEKPS